MAQRRIFELGDRIRIDSCRYKGLGEIVAIRHEIGNARNGSLNIGADVLLASANVAFFFLHDIARWNSEKLDALKE